MKGIFKSRLVLTFVTLVLLAAAIAVSLAGITHSRAATASPNVGTYAIADLGQGAWGGGPLNADGTLGGGGSYSAGNGSVVGKLVPTTWNFSNGGTTVSLCFIVQPIKGPPLFPSGCLDVPVTGTPVIIGGTLFRVTLHHS